MVSQSCGVGHFAQALVALHLVVLLALLDDVGKELAGGLLLDRLAQHARTATRGLCLRFDFTGVSPSSTSVASLLRGRLGGSLCGIFDQEGRLEKLLDLAVFRHHLPELGARGKSPVDAARGALRIGETDGPGVVFLVFDRLVQRFEIELVSDFL